MKIRLLQTVLEGRAVKTIIRNGREPVVFTKGTVLEMSDESAKKYIEKGLAEEVKPAAAE